MTIRGLLNSCNAHPDISIEVIARTGYPCYRGRYDEIYEHYLDKEVDTFSVIDVVETDYGRYFITEMIITLDEDI